MHLRGTIKNFFLQVTPCLIGFLILKSDAISIFDVLILKNLTNGSTMS